MIQAQRNKYLETSVQTATPAQLLIMLLDGAIRFSKAAIEALKHDNKQEAHNSILRTQDIVSELLITLDRTQEISESLARLYEYFNYRLTQANMKKDPEMVEEVLGYFQELKQTWMQAALQTKQNEAAASGTKHA